METHDLQGALDAVYSRFPEARRRPLVGLTGNFADGEARLCDRYYLSVAEAGGVPVVIPPVDDAEVIINTLDSIDALVLTGGGDFDPRWAGEEPSPRLGAVNEARDGAELLAARLAYNRQVPMLGICRGMQAMAMALGGRVDQDIGEAFLRDGRVPGGDGLPAIAHSQEAHRSVPTHEVALAGGSILRSLYGRERLTVNSLHHQAVRDAGRSFRVAATAPDGVVEAMESAEHKPMMGVQWHPEWLRDGGIEIFRWLVREAGTFREAKEAHARILTLDSHCDTPMLFPLGVDLARRDPRALVDMHKMADGRLDAVTMAAYLPQPGPGERFGDVAPSGGLGPRAYADAIIDRIKAIVAGNPSSLALARTPGDLRRNKALGLRSVMLGIENGLALEGDLDNVDHFAGRGVTYITLCHNGDNDLADSARGRRTHGGLSPLGEAAVRRMDALGVMVDLSHASRESFYGALEASSNPVVCSHSNCRALCDHPRNLDDDQLRALAGKGGVAHMTLYPGFLRGGSVGASVMDLLAHLEHAAGVMGIEHVGLGSDFDGDGGVRGLADCSELINLTMHLLRRRYSLADIEGIWGGNWLRVMGRVQGARHVKNDTGT